MGRFLLLVAVVGALTLTGCNDARHPRCNAQPMWPVNNEIGLHGWTLRCDPDALGYEPPSWVQGYADESLMVVALWPERIANDDLLRKTAWHEVGHIVYDDKPRSTTNEEWWADGFAWCHDPTLGVGYMNMPADCGPYAS